MNSEVIFGLQFLLSLVAWGLVGIYLWSPWLAQRPKHEALLWLSLPHAFRHVGMVFLVPGVVDRPLPDEFAVPAAYGDLITGVLALAAIVALRSRWSLAIALVWFFNVVGTIDLANALRHDEVVPSFGAAWFIPIMLVPLLLVTHFMMFKRLLAHER
ncbi:MAG: hypothetical protein ACYTG6_04900 [Planctomycetota bacterium]|jgi:hypothetical protein